MTVRADFGGIGRPEQGDERTLQADRHVQCGGITSHDQCAFPDDGHQLSDGGPSGEHMNSRHRTGVSSGSRRPDLTRKLLDRRRLGRTSDEDKVIAAHLRTTKGEHPPSFERPFLRRPAASWRQHDVATPGTVRVILPPADRGGRHVQPHVHDPRDLESVDQRHHPVHGMDLIGLHTPGVVDPAQLTCIGEADSGSGPRESGEERTASEPLAIQHEFPLALAQSHRPLDRGNGAGRRTPSASEATARECHHGIERRMCGDHVRKVILDEPVDSRIGPCCSERGEHRYRPADISKGAWSNQQK